VSDEFRSETVTCWRHGGIGLDHHLQIAFDDGWEPIHLSELTEPVGCLRCGSSTSTFEVTITYRRRKTENQ